MNHSNPKVSIIIPVYNGSNYLKEAIDSALAQTYQNTEIIVVNDGSNDNGQTEAIAKSYAEKIRYFKKENGGVATALNLGISQMAGDYFSWLSHDDLYLSDKIEIQINFLKKESNKKVILYSDYGIFTDNPQYTIPCEMVGVIPDNFRYWLTEKNYLHGCTLLIPKRAFDDCGMFDPSLKTTQDYDLWFRMAKKYDFIHVPMMLVKSRSHTEQGTITMKKTVYQECNALLINFTKQLDGQELRSGSGQSEGVAYAILSASFFHRSFYQAGCYSAYCSVKRIFHMTLHDIVYSQYMLLKSLFLNLGMKLARNMISPYNRQRIKQFYKSIFVKKPQPVPSGVNAVNNLPLREKFSKVYQDNIFNGEHSRSGAGSDLIQTELIRNAIPNLLKELDIRTFLDAPCGDWYWMRYTELDVNQYIGVDIVPTLIANNQQVFGNEGVAFHCLNLVTDLLPKAQLIFSRDCLVHLSFDDAIKIIRNFKASGAQYLLTTTFTEREQNIDLGTGFWRTLNMQLAPFYFPTPLKLINEGCTEGNNEFTDKCLGLWRLEDINC